MWFLDGTERWGGGWFTLNRLGERSCKAALGTAHQWTCICPSPTFYPTWRHSEGISGWVLIGDDLLRRQQPFGNSSFRAVEELSGGSLLLWFWFLWFQRKRFPVIWTAHLLFDTQPWPKFSSTCFGAVLVQILKIKMWKWRRVLAGGGLSGLQLLFWKWFMNFLLSDSIQEW